MKLTPLKPTSKKTAARNKTWREICMQRAEYLYEKYGCIVCEYSGETITVLATTPVSFEAGWGHHIDGNRNNISKSNCYIVKYRYHAIIHDRNISVKQLGFEGYCG